MRRRIVFYLKNSNFFSELYFLVGTFLVNLLKLFVKPDPKLALFVSYGGKKCNDSPYAIYQAMKADSRFKDWKLVWAFIEPEEQSVQNKVKIDSPSYFKTCLAARVWVTNSGIKRYLNFSGKHTFFVNTWHGIPLKKIGIDEEGVKKSRVFARKWFEFKMANINLFHAEYDLKVLEHVFNAPRSSFYPFGLPRNDQLFRNRDNDELKADIKRKLNISSDKKVVLYAPTVRGEQVTGDKDNVFRNPFHFEEWQKKFPNLVILFRAHYFVNESENTNYPNVINVTDYPSIEELYLISEFLISDYSSVFFDYSILERPMFCYAYDLEAYKKYQGLYLSPEMILPHVAYNEVELLTQINQYAFEDDDRTSVDFRNKFLGKTEGHATEKVIDKIYSEIN
jgi:CDP-glycerol glycerophosphotransferase